MKLTSSSKSHFSKHTIVMIACFIYAGFALLLFIGEVYSAFWLGTSLISPTALNQRAFDQNMLVGQDANHPAREIRPEMSPFTRITSPASAVLILSGIIALCAGITIWSLVRNQEHKRIKEQTAEYLLMPDEKKVIQTLKQHEYALTQSKIVTESGLSKVQVHRVVKRLESKGLLEKHEFGLTNKIVLKKELVE